jgi:Na+-translocating ferredoxin:NAD+ oxidoreductase RNF subunit RnfB
MNPTLLTAITIGGMGAVCGTALAMAAKFLAVHEDPRVESAIDMMPGANCGGCGFAGCSEYARAVALDGAEITLCAPGGAVLVSDLSKLMGVEASAAEKKVAVVMCGGNAENAPRKSTYNGVADCSAAATVGAGDKICQHGCLGYASCSRACPVDAIEISNGLATVHADLCIGCSKCVRTCPRHLIKMVPASRSIHVLCSSKDKGPVVKKACSVGCIGCTICTKLAENESIKMQGFLAIVDYEKDLENEAVIEKCPGKCIVKQSLAPVEIL